MKMVTKKPGRLAITHGRSERKPRKVDVWIDGKGKRECVNVLPIGFPGYSRSEPYWIRIDRIDTPEKSLRQLRDEALAWQAEQRHEKELQDASK